MISAKLAQSREKIFLKTSTAEQSHCGKLIHKFCWTCWIQLFWISLLHSGQSLLQTGADISKWGNFITKWGRYCKNGNHYYKVGQLRAITKWDKVITYYKSGLVIIKQGSILIKRSYRSRSEKDKSWHMLINRSESGFAYVFFVLKRYRPF